MGRFFRQHRARLRHAQLCKRGEGRLAVNFGENLAQVYARNAAMRRGILRQQRGTGELALQVAIGALGQLFFGRETGFPGEKMLCKQIKLPKNAEAILRAVGQCAAADIRVGEHGCFFVGRFEPLQR